jgi:Protein of unknown function (DUF3795)
MNIISNCGLICTECPAYIALKTDDEDLRIKTSVQWSKMYGADIKPEAINCSGCLADSGTLFHHCNVCKIRACCREKAVANCALCADYDCELISEFFGFAPEAKNILEEIRTRI